MALGVTVCFGRQIPRRGSRPPRLGGSGPGEQVEARRLAVAVPRRIRSNRIETEAQDPAPDKFAGRASWGKTKNIGPVKLYSLENHPGKKTVYYKIMYKQILQIFREPKKGLLREELPLQLVVLLQIVTWNSENAEPFVEEAPLAQ